MNLRVINGSRHGGLLQASTIHVSGNDHIVPPVRFILPTELQHKTLGLTRGQANLASRIIQEMEDRDPFSRYLHTLDRLMAGEREIESALHAGRHELLSALALKYPKATLRIIRKFRHEPE
jgi:hypothetical protein